MGEVWETINYDGVDQAVSAEPSWDEDELVFPLMNGGEYRIRNPYWASLSLLGLEEDTSESVTLVGNNRAWGTPEEVAAVGGHSEPV